MSNAGWTAIAALGASALTGLVSWVITYWHDKRVADVEAHQQMLNAVADVLSVSLSLTLRAHHLAVMAEHYRSRYTRLEILVGLETRTDVAGLMEPLLATQDRIGAAVSELWISGNQRLITAANDVQARSAEFVSAMTNAGASGNLQSTGDTSDPSVMEPLRRLGQARQALAAVARDQLKMDPVDLSAEPGDVSLPTAV